MEATIYNQTGKESGKIKLPEKIFGLKWNESTERLVHQVLVSITGNARNPWAHAKTRGEVAGSGIKPWKQKGTGRARHGSRRSPIWVGGGTAHGPRNDRNYDRKINKKMKTKALFAVLSRKLQDNELVFIDRIDLKVPKTKEAKVVISALAKIENFNKLTRIKNAAFLALSEKNESVQKSFQNFGNMDIGLTKDLNILDLLQYRYLVLVDPEESVKIMSAKLK